MIKVRHITGIFQITSDTLTARGEMAAVELGRVEQLVLRVPPDPARGDLVQQPGDTGAVYLGHVILTWLQCRS